MILRPAISEMPLLSITITVQDIKPFSFCAITCIIRLKLLHCEISFRPSKKATEIIKLESAALKKYLDLLVNLL